MSEEKKEQKEEIKEETLNKEVGVDINDEKTEKNIKEEEKKPKKKKKFKKHIPSGNAYIKATFNNTIITITDLDGNVLANETITSRHSHVGFRQ